MRYRFESLDDYWSFIMELAGALALVLKAMPEEEREVVRASVERATQDFVVDGGLEFPGLTLNAAASEARRVAASPLRLA